MVSVTFIYNIYKCKYRGYGIGFDSCSEYLLTDESLPESISSFLELICSHRCMLTIKINIAW